MLQQDPSTPSNNSQPSNQDSVSGPNGAAANQSSSFSNNSGHARHKKNTFLIAPHVVFGALGFLIMAVGAFAGYFAVTQLQTTDPRQQASTGYWFQCTNLPPGSPPSSDPSRYFACDATNSDDKVCASNTSVEPTSGCGVDTDGNGLVQKICCPPSHPWVTGGASGPTPTPTPIANCSVNLVVRVNNANQTISPPLKIAVNETKVLRAQVSNVPAGYEISSVNFRSRNTSLFTFVPNNPTQDTSSPYEGSLRGVGNGNGEIVANVFLRTISNGQVLSTAVCQRVLAVSAGVIATPTPTPASCNQSCNPLLQNSCATGLTCVPTATPTPCPLGASCPQIQPISASGVCRRSECTGSTTCICNTPTPTPTWTPTPSPTPTRTPTPSPTPTRTPTPSPTPTRTPTPSPTPTRTPTPTPTPVAAACNWISMSNGTDAPLALNQNLTFTCGQVVGATAYEFRIRLPDASIQGIGVSGTGSRISQPYQVTRSGKFSAQCRACFSGVCQQWEPWPTQ